MSKEENNKEEFKFSKAYPSPYLRSPDLNGKEATLTIKSWRYTSKKDIGDDGRQMTGVCLAFEETPKEYIAGKTVYEQLQAAVGYDPPSWIGKKAIFFPTTCRFGKDPACPCIRVKV